MRNTLKVLSLTLLLLASVGMAEAGWEEGVQAFRSGNFSQAAQEFKAVVDAQPEFAGGHFMLGQAYMRLKQNSNALTHVKKAYELDPSNVSYQFLLGQTYLSNDRYGEAVQVLKKINPSSLPQQQQNAYQQMMAVALEKSGRSDEALGALRQVARNNPNNDAAWYAYGTAALRSGETNEAVQALEKAVSLDGNDPRKKDVYIKALIRQARETRNSTQKKSVYAKAISPARSLASDGSHEHLLLLGEVQLGAGRYGDAADSLDQAAGKRSNDYYTQFYLAQARTALEQYSPAETAARKALDLANDERAKKRTWTQIGFINEKMKNFEEAKVAYRNAGDQVGLRRVEENQRIAEENEGIEQHNAEIERLQAEQEELERQLEELEGEPPLR